MAVKSLIEWCDATVNPAYGCFGCSPACQHCYAERMAARFSHNPQVAHLFAGTVDAAGRWTGKVNLWPERMEQALKWRKSRRIFVGSMTDLFHPSVPFEFLDRVFAVMALAPRHTFCLLTKRPERMREYLSAMYAGNRYISREAYIVQNGDSRPAPHIILVDLGTPLPNVWLGATIWDQASADRNVPELLQCPAAVRYVSAEPMLEAVDLSKWVGYNPFHENKQNDGKSSSFGSGIRVVRDRRSGENLEVGEAWLGSLEKKDSDKHMPEGQGRKQDRTGLSPDSRNGQREACSCGGTQGCVEIFQRGYTFGDDNQSQEREQVGQPSRELGIGNLFGSNKTCDPYIGASQKQGLSGKIQWCIVGGETGHGARPMHPGWVRSLRDQCVSAGVPFFFKKWSAYKGHGDWELPAPGSRLLDGKTWGEVPNA